MRTAAVVTSLLFLAACTYEAPVPTVSGASLATIGAQQPGRYAALVQSGGWNMKTDLVGFTCSAHAFKADLNPAWEQEMKEALTAALKEVKFVAAVMTPSDVSNQGYNGFLVVSQSNATSKAGVTAGFWEGTATARTDLDAILVVTHANGKTEQQALAGHGVSSESSMTCEAVETAVTNSASLALQDIIKEAIVTTKLLFAQSYQR